MQHNASSANIPPIDSILWTLAAAAACSTGVIYQNKRVFHALSCGPHPSTEKELFVMRASIRRLALMS